jgi:hypothetical protein
MAEKYVIRTKTSKKGNICWQLLDAKGCVIAQDTDKERTLEPIKKLIKKLETWPPGARDLATEADWAKAERIAAQRKPWESWNFAIAKWRGLLQTKDLTDHTPVVPEELGLYRKVQEYRQQTQRLEI